MWSLCSRLFHSFHSLTWSSAQQRLHLREADTIQQWWLQVWARPEKDICPHQYKIHFPTTDSKSQPVGKARHVGNELAWRQSNILSIISQQWDDEWFLFCVKWNLVLVREFRKNHTLLPPATQPQKKKCPTYLAASLANSSSESNAMIVGWFLQKLSTPCTTTPPGLWAANVEPTSPEVSVALDTWSWRDIHQAGRVKEINSTSLLSCRLQCLSTIEAGKMIPGQKQLWLKLSLSVICFSAQDGKEKNRVPTVIFVCTS